MGEVDEGAGMPPFRHSLRKQGIQKDNQPRMDPPLCSDTTVNQIQNLAHPEWVAVKIETSPFDFGLPRRFKITHRLSRAPLINLANLILYV